MIRTYSEQIERVKVNIAVQLLEYEHFAISYDEWTDDSKRSCSGIQAHSINDVSYRSFYLGHRPYSNQAANSNNIDRLIRIILADYGIERKVHCSTIHAADVNPNPMCLEERFIRGHFQRKIRPFMHSNPIYLSIAMRDERRSSSQLFQCFLVVL